MKHLHLIVIMLSGLLFLTISCKDTMTYADYLDREAEAIDLFIESNNLTILKDFPSGKAFKENEFYKDPGTGVYFHIISYGDTTKKLQWKEEVYVRFSGLHYFNTEDTTRYSNLNSSYPEEITFIGAVTSSTKSYYDTPGWAVPLSYVGHTGKVKMIIPFNMGSSYDQSQYEPTYYDMVQYRFENQY
ncbi:MAG: DUF4827 family protein [Proteiniphilum sp.]|jgi:hypothetical protein|nr:DUF4827 family protein [Proteiniphilum sp.]NCB23902.1 DUF4827 family protein [Bacteroidia bacterium]MDD2937054.1 DUF4827 family protein [Proteiniphilum sp.]MDD3075334.1 DUF4827 family protein [Proteiniphilum sp.]MDD3778500.1 DUF4827 family protein [Proteiniphilum sp.]